MVVGGICFVHPPVWCFAKVAIVFGPKRMWFCSFWCVLLIYVNVMLPTRFCIIFGSQHQDSLMFWLVPLPICSNFCLQRWGLFLLGVSFLIFFLIQCIQKTTPSMHPNYMFITNIFLSSPKVGFLKFNWISHRVPKKKLNQTIKNYLTWFH